jgi:hypothetical protein
VDKTPTVGTRKKSASKKRDVSYHAISSRLGSFRISRNFISLTDDIKKSEAQVRKVKGSIYKKESSLFECLFSTRMLPIKMNLPMICKTLPRVTKESFTYTDGRPPILVSSI